MKTFTFKAEKRKDKEERKYCVGEELSLYILLNDYTVTAFQPDRNSRKSN